LFTIAIDVGLALSATWAAAAIYFDMRPRFLRIPAAVLYAALVVGAFLAIHPVWSRSLACFAGFAAVLLWWIRIKPSNARVWQADVAQTAWAEIDGDRVTIHNYRRCEYRAEFDYTCAWETKVVQLSEIRGIDLFVTYWGSRWIAHPITSFQIGERDHVAFSIELRKQKHERYSPIRGFFRSYGLIYTVAPEADLVRLRTNFRKGARRLGEDVYLYRTVAGPDWSRLLFLAYIRRINELHRQAEWYNAITSNCTTNIFSERAAADRFDPVPAGSERKVLNRVDWRILLNGKGDKMEYQRGDLVTGGLSFQDLRAQAYINPVARALPDGNGFSERIRENRVGF
jgi:hypothetical protein